MLRDRFRPELFVGRIAERKAIQAWAQREPATEERVCSVIGPPGFGKSWFLAQIIVDLEALGHPVLLADLNVDNGIPRCDLLHPSGREEWLKTQIAHISQAWGAQLDPYDDNQSPDSNLRTFARLICEGAWRRAAPVLVIDGLEEVANNGRIRLQREVIDRVLLESCFRVVVAKRDEQALIPQYQAEEYAFHLRVFEPSAEGTEQLRLRLADRSSGARPLPTAALQMVKASLKHYQWDYPLLNSLLLDVIQPRLPGAMSVRFSAAEILKILQDLVLPQYIGAEHFRALATLALLDTLQLSDLIRLGFSDGLADPRIVFLFEQGLLVNGKSVTARTLSVASEIRAIVMDWAELDEGSES